MRRRKKGEEGEGKRGGGRGREGGRGGEKGGERRGGGGGWLPKKLTSVVVELTSASTLCFWKERKKYKSVSED